MQAYKAVGESTEIPLTYYENNVSATLYLLQVMAEYDCTRFVYSSSATVYGTPPVIPIPESTRLQADSPYGKTKVMSETIIGDLCAGKSTCRSSMGYMEITYFGHHSRLSMARTFASILQVRFPFVPFWSQ